jgi:hypothetical protein
METFWTSLESVGVLFAVAIVGLWAIYRRILPESSVPILSILALDIALPCQVFATLVTRFHPRQTPDWWHLPLGWAGFTAFSLLFTLLTAPAFSRPNRRECRLAVFYQNAIFVPLILITHMHGADSPLLIHLFLFTLFFPAFLFNTTGLFFPGAPHPIRPHRVLTPTFLATVLAVTLKLADVGHWVPGFVTSAAGLVGQMATPALLLLLGASVWIDFRSRGQPAWRDILVFVALRNLLFPILVILGLMALRVPVPLAQMCILQAAVPPVTALPLLAERSGGNRYVVNQLMVAGFLASILMLPVILAVGHWALERP